MSVEKKIPTEEILLDNLGKIAYTLDKTYLSRLEEDYGVLPFNEKYNLDENGNRQVTYTSNIRVLHIKRCVIDKEERAIDCFKNVIGVFGGSEDTLALVFKRTHEAAEMYFVVKNIGVGQNEKSAGSIKLLADSIRGNFPGTEVEILSNEKCFENNSNNDDGDVDVLDLGKARAISVLAGIPTEKSEKFTCQGIERLLNGIVPGAGQENGYTVVFLAEALSIVEIRNILNGFEELATAIAPFAGYQFQTGSNSTETEGEMSSLSHSEGISHAVSKTHSVNVGINGSRFSSVTNGVSLGLSQVAGTVLGTAGAAIGSLVCPGVGTAVGGMIGKALGGLAPNLSRSKTSGSSRGFSAGYGFSYGTTDTNNTQDTETTGTNHSISTGTSENTTYTYKSYLVNDLLEKLSSTIKRIDQSKSNGLWRYAAYVLADDANTTAGVANFLKSITQGDESYIEPSFIQTWIHEGGNEPKPFDEIMKYVQHFCHPVFGNMADGTLVMPTMNVSTTELANVFSFPKKSVAGLPILECAEFGRNISVYDKLKDGDSLPLGKIFHMNRSESADVSLNKNSLALHAFITGSTGSGKSNTVYKLLSEAEKSEVNFLVVEPAKGEYKNIFGDRASVYGTNKSKTPLLRMDPFSFPKDIHVLEHLDRLVEIFNVCWPMYAAMPAVLKNAVEKAYEDCGWDLLESANEFGENLFPNFSDVARNVKHIIDSSEYNTENKGAYKGSLLTRLNSLTNGINGLIFNSEELSAESLFDRNVIVDLSRVGSSETKSLIMGMLVLKLQEHRMTSSRMNSELKHITVLEEAHNLLKRISTEQPVEGGNLIGKSVEMLANSIAEMRTYGEGFVIVDQAPGLLDASVIRNTNTKIIMRLPDQADRELAGKSANLSDNQITELAKLPCGVAAVYQNEWVQPVLCKVDKFDYNEKPYVYEEESLKEGSTKPEKLLEIAELLSSGTAKSRDAILKEIDPILQEIRVASSVRIKIFKLLENPPREPRMTRLAPVMSALFPNVRKAVAKAYLESPDPMEWTNAAERVLREDLIIPIHDQVRRDILQALVIDYVFNQLGKVDDVERWTKEGLK